MNTLTIKKIMSTLGVLLVLFVVFASANAALADNTRSADFEKDNNQYLSISDANQTGLDLTGDFTLETWLKMEDEVPLNQKYGLITKWFVGSNISYTLEYGQFTHGFAVELQLSANGTQNDNVLWDVDLGTGEWKHLAVTFNASSSESELWVDGVSQGVKQHSISSILDSSAEFRIGGRFSNGIPVDGLMDDVRVWDDVRTEAEIIANKDNELIGSETNLVGYWKLNNDATDETANGNDLTNNNSVLFSSDVPFPVNELAPIFDASTEDYAASASSQTFNHTIPTDGVLIVSAGNRDKGAPTSITFNGDAPDESYVEAFQGIYAWQNPTSGAGTVSINYSGSGFVGAHALTYTNVDTSDVIGVTNWTGNTTGPGTTAITGSVTTGRDNSVVLSSVYGGNPTFTFVPTSGQIEREEGSPGGNFSMVTGDIIKAAAGTQEMHWTMSSAQGWHHIMAEIHGAVNQPPVLDPIGDKTVSEGQLLQFTVTATDPDGDDLTFSASNLPPGATFTTSTATFSWTPGFSDAGNYPDVEFTVTDDGDPMELDVELITITVGDVNRAPVFTNPGPQDILEDEELSFSVSATDPDGDTVTLSASGTPTGATFSTSTGSFTWTPSLAQAGVYVVSFIATDDGTPQESASIDVVITVGDNPTPEEQAEDLVEDVIDADFPANVENSYLANLQKVEQFIAQGKIQPAINQLNAFINKVEQDLTQGNITQAERDLFVGLAEDLIDDLSN